MAAENDDVQQGAELFSEETGEVRTGLIPRQTLPPALVDYEVIDGQAIFEGDIILGTAEEFEEGGQPTPMGLEGIGITGDRFRWRNGVIPFTIDPGLPNQSRVTNAIAHWESRTSVDFVERTTETDFITFRSGTGCSSSIGRRSGQQFINLAAGCSTGNTIHEIGHTVGLWHEHSREDRDSFVTIHFDNIEPGKAHNFNQHITDGDDIGEYDYGSIMHYGASAFAVDPSEPTIEAPNRSASVAP